MKGFVDDIEDAAIRNSNFRQVLYTSGRLQLVVMALEPGEDIGEEVHEDRDQYFRVEKGKGEVWIDGTRTKIRRNSAMVVPAGARHNVVNTGGKVLRLATIYGPPEHRDGIVHVSKADAQLSEEHFDGTTTEQRKPAKSSAKTSAPKSAAKATSTKATSAKSRPAKTQPANSQPAKSTRTRTADTD